MNLILKDFIRRWGLAYALSLLIQFLFLVLLDTKQVHLQGFSTILNLFIGAPLLAFDLNKGAGRLLLSLPVRRGAIAMAFWMISVGIPGLLSAATALGSFLIFRPKDGNSMLLLLYPWFVVSACGILFLLLTVMPPGQQRGFWRNTLSGLAGAAWGWFLGGAMLFLPGTTVTWSELKIQHWIFLIVGTLAVLAGGWASEHWLVNRASFRVSQSSPPTKPIRLARKEGLLGGWIFLGWMQASQVFLFGIGATIIILAIDKLSASGRESQQTLLGMLPVQVGFFASMLFSMRWAFSMRALRLAPITPDRLCLLLTALCVGPGLVFAVFIGALMAVWGSQVPISHLVVVGLLVAGLSCAALPLSLSLVKSHPSYISSFLMVLIVFSISPLITETMVAYTSVPVVVAGAICAGLVLASLLALRYLLRNSSDCYQATMTSFPKGW